MTQYKLFKDARYAIIFVWLLLLASETLAAPSIPAWETGQQLVVVQSADWSATTATLTRFEKRRFGWRRVGDSIRVSLGKQGSAWGLGLHIDPPEQPSKREGDGKAPAGLFAIGFAFGAKDAIETGLPYQAMDQHDWCIDVPGSPFYNRIVDQNQVGKAATEGSSEPMRRDLHLGDDLYQSGFVIAHNLAGEDRRGSCIFAHRWRSTNAPTAGCTAMAAADLEQLLRWLDARREPRFLLLPESEYRALKRAWKLPRSQP